MPRTAEPVLVVLVGASGAGKSSWAQRHYRSAEIVSSDELRGIVGSGRHDLEASTDAFALLDQIVDARLRRRLTCVVDTVGLDAGRRRGYRDRARQHGVRATVVVVDAPPTLVRTRNAERDRPVPATALAAQLKRMRSVLDEIASEGWDEVVVVPPDTAAPAPEPVAVSATAPDAQARAHDGPEVILQLSRFPWGADPSAWLRDVALAADAVGFDGIALMDHLIQIPQVGRAWEPIPEPWVTLGLLAALDTDLRLGTLVSPVTWRPAGVTAKAVATLDALSGGRAFLGLGAGWWRREHDAFGLPFPPPDERLDRLAVAVETIRALLAPGTKPYAGAAVTLPETTNYPRPVGRVPIIVGGAGRRTLRLAAQWADGCNVPGDDDLPERVEYLRRCCTQLGREPADVAVTVLDIPVIGRDRDEVWERVERLRGRTAAAEYARRHFAGTPAEQRERYRRLADHGVETVFLALPSLGGPDDLAELAPLFA